MGRFITGTTLQLFRGRGSAGAFALLVFLAAFMAFVLLAFGGCSLVTGLSSAALRACRPAGGLRERQAGAEQHCAH